MCNDSLYRGVRVLHHTSGDIEQVVPALVDEATWFRAHAQLAQNRVLPMTNGKYTYLLRGRIYCGACGRMLQGNYQARVNRLYYGCPRAREKAGMRERCDVGYFRGELSRNWSCARSTHLSTIQATLWTRCATRCASDREAS